MVVTPLYPRLVQAPVRLLETLTELPTFHHSVSIIFRSRCRVIGFGIPLGGLAPSAMVTVVIPLQHEV